MKNRKAEVMERFSLFLAGVAVGVVLGAIIITLSYWVYLSTLFLVLASAWYLGQRAYQ